METAAAEKARFFFICQMMMITKHNQLVNLTNEQRKLPFEETVRTLPFRFCFFRNKKTSNNNRSSLFFWNDFSALLFAQSKKCHTVNWIMNMVNFKKIKKILGKNESIHHLDSFKILGTFFLFNWESFVKNQKNDLRKFLAFENSIKEKKKTH